MALPWSWNHVRFSRWKLGKRETGVILSINNTIGDYKVSTKTWKIVSVLQVTWIKNRLHPDMLWSLGRESLLHSTIFVHFVMVLFLCSYSLNAKIKHTIHIKCANSGIKNPGLCFQVITTLHYVTRKDNLKYSKIRGSAAYRFLVWG
jgi:hypothetical protein